MLCRSFFTTLLLMSSPTTSSSTSSGLTPSEFHTILLTESASELQSLPNNGSELWESLTQNAWDKMSNSSATPYPFIVCNYTPNLSGYKRRQQVESLFDGKGTFSQYALYNKDDKACFLVRSLADAASSVRANPSDDFKIHPLLAMMKTRSGTLKSCRERFGSRESTGSPVRIIASLGPGVASDKESGKKLGEEILKRIRDEDEDAFKAAVNETFPSSGSGVVGTVGDLNDDFFGQVTVSSDRKGQSLFVEIDRSTIGISASKILTFVSELAIQSEVTAVEVEGEFTPLL